MGISFGPVRFLARRFACKSCKWLSNSRGMCFLLLAELFGFGSFRV